ncbi:MAG: class I SAM-dependent methyltransferase [Neomegalonema sp.]|nr:class I SAM-dependent methyltransferase [Neomegalonema sp.]
MSEAIDRNSFSTIKTSHGLDGNSDALKNYYAKWASNYDDDVENQKYIAPSIITDLSLLVTRSYLHKKPQQTTVLDAGCGTGLVGVNLKKRGFGRVDGFDLSSEMTDIAKSTEAYFALKGGVDLNRDQPNWFGRTYELLVCCGVLTLGHVAPTSLRRLANYLEPGGCMIVSTRNSYLADGSFAEVSAQLQAEGVLNELFCVPDAWYIEEEGAHYWIYQRCGAPKE